METFQLLLKLRIRWYQLNAKEFFLRYQYGLIVIVLFLPGVLIGDNFHLLMNGIATPFLQITDAQAPFFNKLSWLLVLQFIFVTFCRAQKQAITGGAFTIYMQSLPIKKSKKIWMDLLILLLANHLLWIIVVAGFYFQIISGDNDFYLRLVNNTLLVIFLLTSQYMALFKLKAKFVFTFILINILLIANFSNGIEYIGFVFFLWFLLIFKLLKPTTITNKTINQTHTKTNRIKHNFYFQLLFNATLSSTLFRLLFILFLVIGFFMVSSILLNNNSGNLFPYAMVFEAFLAYYFSGFFGCFEEQRQQMKSMLLSLPIPRLFWFWRDYITVVVLSSLFQIILFMLLINNFAIKELVILIGYFVLLLLVCYPIRIFVKSEQTIFTFLLLTIITAITLNNYS